MKQTAIDYLIKELKETLNLKNQLDTELAKTIIEEAKQLQQEQITTAWHDGNLLGRNGWIQEEYSTPQQYYNHTYEK